MFRTQSDTIYNHRPASFVIIITGFGNKRFISNQKRYQLPKIYLSNSEYTHNYWKRSCVYTYCTIELKYFSSYKVSLNNGFVCGKRYGRVPNIMFLYETFTTLGKKYVIPGCLGMVFSS